ncbi:MAG TPA: hypothetical protein VFX02_08590 [Gammaproteobacteria bacterium]|nr:hypothetical protein [Gammaproteobacteria bacterium]
MTNFRTSVVTGMLDVSMLPRGLRTVIESELQPGERIDWLGQPLPGRMAFAALPAVLFAIVWTAFSIFWVYGAGAKAWIEGGEFQVFPLFGVPFVLIGFTMLFSPFWIMRSARYSAYVLTDRRAVLFKAGLRSSVNIRSFEPAQLANLQRNQRADGSGDLVFTQDVGRDSDGDRTYRNVGFMAIQDVKGVEERVRELVRRTRSV